jgi:hypothetical protein
VKNVINGMKRMFSFVVLRGCIGARKAKKNTMGEIFLIGSIIKFATIITLNKSYGNTKVHESILPKVC